MIEGFLILSSRLLQLELNDCATKNWKSIDVGSPSSVSDEIFWVLTLVHPKCGQFRKRKCLFGFEDQLSQAHPCLHFVFISVWGGEHSKDLHRPKVKFNRSKNLRRWTFLNNFITEIEIESGTVCLTREDRSIFSWNVKVSYQTVIAQDNCGNYVVGRKLNVGKSMNWEWINWKWMCFALIS